MIAEFSCFMDEFLQVMNMNRGNDDDIIIKIKGIVLTRKEIHTLTIKYDYDSFNKCLDDKVCP